VVSVKKFKVGIIGAGRGGSALLETLIEMDNIEIQGIADIDSSAKAFGAAKRRA